MEGKVSNTTDPENCSSLRLVWVDLYIRKSNLDAVLERLNIKLAYRYGFTGPGSFAFLPVTTLDMEDRVHNYSVFMPDLFTIAWTRRLSFCSQDIPIHTMLSVMRYDSRAFCSPDKSDDSVSIVEE